MRTAMMQGLGAIGLVSFVMAAVLSLVTVLAVIAGAALPEAITPDILRWLAIASAGTLGAVALAGVRLDTV